MMKSTAELESELAHILQTGDTGYVNEDDVCVSCHFTSKKVAKLKVLMGN